MKNNFHVECSTSGANLAVTMGKNRNFVLKTDIDLLFALDDLGGIGAIWNTRDAATLGFQAKKLARLLVLAGDRKISDADAKDLIAEQHMIDGISSLALLWTAIYQAVTRPLLASESIGLSLKAARLSAQIEDEIKESEGIGAQVKKMQASLDNLRNVKAQAKAIEEMAARKLKAEAEAKSAAESVTEIVDVTANDAPPQSNPPTTSPE